MAEANALVTVNYSQLFIGFVAILLTIKSIGVAFDYIQSKFKFKTGAQINREHTSEVVNENHSEIEKLKENNRELSEKVDKICDKVDLLTDAVVEERIDSIRFKVTDSACHLRGLKERGRGFSKEQYEQLFLMKKKYKHLVEKYGIYNGQIDASFRFLENSYQEQLATGFADDGE